MTTKIPVELSSTPGIVDNSNATAITIDSSEDVTLAGNINLVDSKKAIFGVGNDLQIYHDGSNSFISETGTGNLYIQGAGTIRLRGTTTEENLIEAVENGAVSLYYDNSVKLATTTTGATLSGTLVVDHGSYTTSITGNSITFSRDTDSRILANATTSSKLLIESGDQIRSTAPSYHSWKTGSGADERVRINSSGYLLVGKTDTSFTTNGTEIRGGNLGARIIRQNAEPLTLHRQGSDGDVINLFVDSTQIGSLGTSSSDLVFTSSVSDKDILFKGNDGGSGVTALQLDMSEGGNARFYGLVGINKVVNAAVALSVGADATSTTSYGLEVTNSTANTRFLVNGEGSSFFYKTNNAVGMEFDANSGNLKFASGQGIDFSATGDGSGSMTSELLDDYEEGTWTPTFAGVAAAAVYGARYTKIGQLVMVESYIAGDTQNNTNQFQIGGLPYTSQNVTAYGGGSIGYTSSQDYSDFGSPLIPANSSYIYFHRIDGSSSASVVNNILYNRNSGNQLFLFQAFYRTA